MPPPKPAPTHFLCLPLAGPQLGRNWAAFRADVTSPAGAALPGDAVRPLGTLHLTLGVMSLKPDGVDGAVRVLEGLRPRALLAELRAASTAAAPVPNDQGMHAPRPDHGGGLAVTLRGLHAMHSASKTSVLYAAPHDPDGLVRRFCELLRQPFRDAGLVEDDRRPLLLHATLVNTIYVKGGRGGGGRRERMTVDAREVLQRYGEFVWAEGLPLTKLAICRMGAKKVEGGDGGDAAYEVEAETDI
ncbi:AKAP7 2'5' RNA ligase-like domain-containing protein [Hirsutella rhossiliensis]|uniref:AKAP7 2'5' RNA ligase-like domain-containing protein n=1 Tax=Hirsutella rhossiliensis TaxID=111463 RepID=A0A9P8N783_9HYPO|nr:AKAP7 2'5' RNA ligase-like domain-containing protein [Hirsutella rhossiliensis]KAH0968267.1 AKAP7 2'5' RNA ligase-like domain-containing protein [Hirsutella rhossiliensis]